MSSATVNRTQLLISANRLEPDTNEATECPKFVVPYWLQQGRGLTGLCGQDLKNRAIGKGNVRPIIPLNISTPHY